MATLGSYNIIRQIGEGGFGRTYEAHHILNPNIKACLKQNIDITDDDAKLLINEAELLAKVHHTSLPAFRDLYRAQDNSMILAMSFIEGKSLDKIIEKHKALHPEEVSWIAQRSLNALFYLHHEGIIHGDVKPPNLLIEHKKHNAVLVDYGLSIIRPTSTTKATGYTQIFAAPEIKQGKPPLPESDLYSLALTMTYAWGGDPITKTHPDYVHPLLQQFVTDLTNQNPLDRSNWEKQDLIKRLSDIRNEAFGRRSSMS